MNSNSVHKINDQLLRNWTQTKNQYLEEIFFLKNEDDQIKMIEEFIDMCKAGIDSLGRHRYGNRAKMDLVLSYNDFLCFPIVSDLIVAKQLSVSLDLSKLKALDKQSEKSQEAILQKLSEGSTQKGGIRREAAFLSEGAVYPNAIDKLSKD